MFYQVVFQELNKRKIRYIVVGGIALNLIGVPRMTADLDIVVDMDQSNLSLLIDCMEEIGFKPRLPVDARELLDEDKRREWRELKHLQAFTFYKPEKDYQEVDILLKPELDFDTLASRSKAVFADDIEIPVVSAADLIKLKDASPREQDRADVAALRKVMEETGE